MSRSASEMLLAPRTKTPVHTDTVDDCTRTGNLFRLFTRDQQERLFKNIAAAMESLPEEIVERQLRHLRCADPQYAEGVVRILKGRARR